MEMSRESGYGLRVAILLARRGGEVSMADIESEHNMSPGYLAKIVGQLVHAGLVVPTGPNRVTLVMPASQITLADIVLAYGPVSQLNRCLIRHGSIHPCGHVADCALCDLWRSIQKDLVQLLRRYTLAEFALRADAIAVLGELTPPAAPSAS